MQVGQDHCRQADGKRPKKLPPFVAGNQQAFGFGGCDAAQSDKVQ
jgi:hypothetical protein